MKTPRLLAALVVLSLAALLCPGHPARAQGQWYPGYVPCYADGTPVPPAMTDGKGLEVMAGTLTGRPAGGQSIPYAQYGRYLYSFNPNSPSVPDPFPYDPLADSSIPGLWVSSRNGLLSSDGPDVSVTSGAGGQTQVSLHAYFLWKPGYDCDNPPSGPPPPPPPTASFLLQTQLSASYSNSYQRQPYASGPDPTTGISSQAQVQDGYGELAQVIVAAPPYPYSYGSHGVSGTATAGGLHLVTVGVQTVGGKGIYTINLSGSAQAQAANSLNGANFVGEASATATLSGGAKHDDRAVTISANVDPTLAKGPRHDESGTEMYNIYGDQMFTPHPHSREPDGTMYGDLGIDEVTNIPLNSITVDYQGNRSGNWHIDGDTDLWFTDMTDSISTPDHQGDTMTSSSPNISNFGVKYNGDTVAGVPGGALDNGDRVTLGTNHIHLTYTDGGDKAKATANYYMTVHRPYEYILSKKPAEADWRPVSITIDPNQSFGNDSPCSFTYNADNPMVAEVTFDGTGKTATVGTLTVAGAATPLPWLNALLTAGAFGLDKFGPVPAHGGADFVQCFESNYSTFNVDRPSDYFSLSLDERRKVRAHYKIQPYFFVRYTKKYYIVDTWDWKGYAGQQYRMLETLDQSADGSPAATQPLGAFSYDGVNTTPPAPVFPGN